METSDTGPESIPHSGQSGHYVYLYRDSRGRARYVGYGRDAARATHHQGGSHNSGLEEFLAAEAFSVEIAGPFESETVGRTVESSLISALRPDFNKQEGPTKWRFRPVGVPLEFAERTVMEPLTEEDFVRNAACPVLFVYVNSDNFSDGRVGYDLADPPTDCAVLHRIDRWWQLGRRIPAWISAPQTSPVLLVGVHGRPSSRIIIGAVEIDRFGWGRAERKTDGRFSVPTVDTRNLDAYSYRGRRLLLQRPFNSFPSQAYILLQPDGRLEGGVKPK